MLRWVIVACLVACSSPPPKGRKPTRDWLSRVEATSDSAKPQRISLDEHNRGDIRARASGIGTWWYSVEVPTRDIEPGITGWLTTTNVYVASANKHISLEVIDDRGQSFAGIRDKYGGADVSLPETATPPRSLLIGVTTSKATTFTVRASVSRRAIPEPPPTPCDPLHIDPANPECKDVNPPCDFVSPSFTNPNCCHALTCNLVSGCFAKVTARVSKNTIKLSIGTRDGIMTFATGLVQQRNQKVTKGHVESVEDDAVIFRVDEPEKLDESILLSYQTQVRLMQPEWCRQARPIHNVEAAPSP